MLKVLRAYRVFGNCDDKDFFVCLENLKAGFASSKSDIFHEQLETIVEQEREIVMLGRFFALVRSFGHELFLSSIVEVVLQARNEIDPKTEIESVGSGVVIKTDKTYVFSAERRLKKIEDFVIQKVFY